MGEIQTCAECGKNFIPYNNRKNILFCSYGCGMNNVYRRRRKVRKSLLVEEYKVCPQCGKYFTMKSHCKLYCSTKCGQSFRARDRSAIREREDVAIKCYICDNIFYPKAITNKYCSPPCRQKASSNRTVRARKTVEGKDYVRKWKAWQPSETMRSYRLKTTYGITLEEYKDILKKQNNKCAICSSVLDGGRRTHVDHNHKYDKRVRGILCGTCNSGLGFFHDDPLLVKSALHYLLYWEAVKIVEEKYETTLPM